MAADVEEGEEEATLARMPPPLQLALPRGESHPTMLWLREHFEGTCEKNVRDALKLLQLVGVDPVLDFRFPRREVLKAGKHRTPTDFWRVRLADDTGWQRGKVGSSDVPQLGWATGAELRTGDALGGHPAGA